MRHPERALITLWSKIPEARHGTDRGHFEPFRCLHRRQDAGHAGGQHGFARTRRATHQQVQFSRGRNRQCALGASLPAYIGHIGVRRCVHRAVGCLGVGQRRAAEMRAHLQQMLRGNHAGTGNPRCLGGIRPGHDQCLAVRMAGDGRGQCAGDAADFSAQRQFAEKLESLETAWIDLPRCAENPECDREIVTPAFLRQIGGCEIDRHA